MFIKKGDKVVVITGKDKGKVGTVIEAQPKKDRVVVEGVNIIKNTLKILKTHLKVESLKKKQQFTYQT